MKGKKKKTKAERLAGFKPTTSQVSALEACALPLCYNRFPRLYHVENTSSHSLTEIEQHWAKT